MTPQNDIMFKRCIGFLIFSVFLTSLAFGQVKEVVKVSATTISQSDIKLNENLRTAEGHQLATGLYRIAVTLDSKGAAKFVLIPHNQPEPSPNSSLSRHSLSVRGMDDNSLQFEVPAVVKKNTFIRGVASVEGTFKLDNLTPSEAILSFQSRQFEAQTTLGRPLDSKLVDLVPTFATIEQSSQCGVDCVEGFVKVMVRNDGNIEAKGKWNVVLSDRNFFVGILTDVPAGQEVGVTSTTKLRLPSGSTASLEVEVHADFYNKDVNDSNDVNNTKRFIIKLEEESRSQK